MILRLLALTIFLTVFSSTSSAWSISRPNSCNSATLNLSLPAIDLTCDLDEDSGNPSQWLNPYATCSLEFDMIGLPSLADLAGGVAGQVCDAIQTVKDQTIDVLIDEINNQIPDVIGDDVDLGIDLGDTASGVVSDILNPSVETTETADENGLCYISIPNGSTVTYPCDMLSNTSTVPNTCYLYDESDHNSYERVECDRFNVSREVCATTWIDRYVDGVFFKEPSTYNCIEANEDPFTSNLTVCYDDDGYAVKCSSLTNVSNDERMCYKGNGSQGICSQINQEQLCYGHKDGAFQVLACKEFITVGIENAYDGYTW